jgi:Resolvase, N terminal domain
LPQSGFVCERYRNFPINDLYSTDRRNANFRSFGEIQSVNRRSKFERRLTDLEFNSLDAQRDACEAYIMKSQASQGWKALPQQYDDPAYSGGNLDRPALQKLLADIEVGRIDVVVVYKIDASPARSPTSPSWSKPLMPDRFPLWPSPSSSIPPRP